MTTNSQTPDFVVNTMRKNQVICAYIVDKDGDALMPGTLQCPQIDSETLYGDDKRADVSFPLPEQDPMDWLGPLATPEQMPQEGALYPVPAENPHDQVNPRFGKVTYLADHPYAQQAEAIMRKVALLVRPIMDENKWTVNHLTEMYTSEKDDGCYGFNLGRGETIFVRLREIDDKSIFLEFEEILNTVLHELIHNWYDDHDGDFAALWYDLALRFGASMGCVTHQLKTASRPTQHPKGHISVFLAGTRIFLSEEAYKKHFSIWAQRHQDQDEQTLQSRYQLSKFRTLYINKGYDHDDYCVYARLIQIARGLDPAINKSIKELPNNKEFHSAAFADESEGIEDDITFPDIHGGADAEANWAMNLYMHMWRIGTKVGMHASTRDWLIEQITHLLSWGPKIDGDHWHHVFRLAPERFYDGIMWSFPSDLAESSVLLGKMVCNVYGQTTTPEGQCLRDIVIARLKEIQTNSVHAARYYDLKLLLEILRENEDLSKDLDATVV